MLFLLLKFTTNQLFIIYFYYLLIYLLYLFSNFRQKYFPDLIFFENGVFFQVFDIAKLSVNFV